MTLQPGELILNGKYRVERLLGRGAFGEVYLVTHLLLDAALAIKVLRKGAPGMGSTQFDRYRDRFLLEAQLGKRLNQPNVVRVDDCVEEDGVLYLVMEFCEGGTLAARLDRNRAAGQPMAVDEAVRIAAEVAAGLAALHDLEAVHRDLKPGNILFDRGGRQGGGPGPGADPGRQHFRLVGRWPQIPARHAGLQEPGAGGQCAPAAAAVRRVCAGRRAVRDADEPAVRQSEAGGAGPRCGRACRSGWMTCWRMLAEKPATRPWDGAEAAELLRAGGREQAASATAEQQEPSRGSPEHAESQDRCPQSRRRCSRRTLRPIPSRRPGAGPPRWPELGIEPVLVPAGPFIYGEDRPLARPAAHDRRPAGLPDRVYAGHERTVCRVREGDEPCGAAALAQGQPPRDCWITPSST